MPFLVLSATKFRTDPLRPVGGGGVNLEGLSMNGMYRELKPAEVKRALRQPEHRTQSEVRAYRLLPKGMRSRTERNPPISKCTPNVHPMLKYFKNESKKESPRKLFTYRDLCEF